MCEIVQNAKMCESAGKKFKIYKMRKNVGKCAKNVIQGKTLNFGSENFQMSGNEVTITNTHTHTLCD